jgi:lipoyl(octanoyl) transferase
MGVPLLAPTSTAVISVTHAGVMDYQSALDMQRKTHADIAVHQAPNHLILLQHNSVFTAGRRTQDFERPTDGTPVIDVDRGGKITWHGLGQLVGYPIVRLAKRHDVVGFVREIENALIDACAEFGLKTERYCERSGVWVRDERGDRKIAAIGIRFAKGITMHGFAININPDLSWFDRIIPCGIAEVEVTSLSRELGRDITVQETTPVIEHHILLALQRVSA